MDDKVAQLILDELFSSLEVLETQSAAVLLFLKEKASSSDEQLAPYLEQAGKASSTKRRAARVRIDYLISGIADPPAKAVERDVAKGEKKPPEPKAEKPKEKAHEKDAEDQSGDQRKKTEGESEAKTEENSKGEERAKEHAAAGAGRNEKEQEKRTAGPAVDNEKKDKPTQPDTTEEKTGEKRKNEKASGQKPTEKSSTSK